VLRINSDKGAVRNLDRRDFPVPLAFLPLYYPPLPRGMKVGLFPLCMSFPSFFCHGEHPKDAWQPNKGSLRRGVYTAPAEGLQAITTVEPVLL
jgi:hypothetical protein